MAGMVMEKSWKLKVEHEHWEKHLEPRSKSKASLEMGEACGTQKETIETSPT